MRGGRRGLTHSSLLKLKLRKDGEAVVDRRRRVESCCRLGLAFDWLRSFLANHLRQLAWKGLLLLFRGASSEMMMTRTRIVVRCDAAKRVRAALATGLV